MFILTNPQIIEFSVWSQLPSEFRKNQPSEWGNANRPNQLTDSFLEGPVFDIEGNLFVTDIPWGRIFKITPEGKWILIAEYDGEPNGMKFISPEDLLITDYKNGLLKCNIKTGHITPYLTRRNSERFKGVNDLIIDKSGNIFFTDQGQTGLHDPTGCVYRLRKNGQLDLLLNNVPSPNGLALSPLHDVLFVAVTRGNCVWRVPLSNTGGVHKVSQFFTSYGPSGPDGLAMDQMGNLLVCNPGLGVVWLLNSKAEPLIVFRSPTGTSTTNIAIGGKQGRTLYCTESVTGSILQAELPYPALPLCSL